MSSIQDTGLVCPACEYNLTGLDEAHCPECGGRFTWEEVKEYSRQEKPVIAFEKAAGWQKIPAFFVTWLTVLFVPWVFAEQIVKHVGAGHAAIFGALCFAGTALAFISGMDWPFWGAWLTTAFLYVLAQTVLLSLADPQFYQKRWATLRFWFLVGAYTSAIMPTEIVRGPPMIEWDRLWNWLQGTPIQSIWSVFSGYFLNEPCWLPAVQLLVWLLGIACCVDQRWRLSRWNWPWAIFLVVPLSLLVLMLYVVTVWFIGPEMFSLYGGSLFK